MHLRNREAKRGRLPERALCLVGFVAYNIVMNDDKSPEFMPLPKAENSTQSPEAIEAPDLVFFCPDIEASETDRNFLELWLDDEWENPGEKTAEAREAVVRLYSQLGPRKHEAIAALVRFDTDDVNALLSDIDYINSQSHNVSEFARQSVYFDASEAFLAYVKYFNKDAYGDTMREEFMSELVGCSERPAKEWKRSIEHLSDGINTAAIGRNPNMVHAYVNFIEELEESANNQIGGNEHHTKADLFKNYCRNHGLNDEIIEGFRERISPMVDENDPHVRSLMTDSNSFGDRVRAFGISDFTIQTLASRNNPRNIRDLLMVFREIPTSDYSRFESNRNDAAALSGFLWQSREFIHNERPGLHELFEAMVIFYDTKDNPSLHEQSEARLREIINSRLDPQDYYQYAGAGFDGKLCLDLSNYDKTVEATTHCNGDRKDYNEPAIDILRRLEENTRQVSLEKPKCGIAEIDAKIQDLPVNQLEDGRVVVGLSDVSSIIKDINEHLWNNRNERVLDSDMIHTLSFLERMATYAVRNLSDKEYRELAFDPGFKEICKFSELTASAKPFDPGDFERFWHRFSEDFSRGWPDDISAGYRQLTQRVTWRLNELSLQYRKEGAYRYMIDSLWSGNLDHELMGLIDKAGITK